MRLNVKSTTIPDPPWRDERQQSPGVDRRVADDGRRGDDADRDRRGLPRLQRQQRAAVRARVPGRGRGSRRSPAGQEQRGPDRWLPGRGGRVDRRDPVRRGSDHRADRRLSGRRSHGRGDRPAQPEARQERRAHTPGLDLPGPLPLLVRAQVPRDHPRHRRGCPRGLHLRRHRRRRHLRAADRPRAVRQPDPRPRPRTAASRRRPSSTTSTTPSTPRPAPTGARTWSATARASPAAAPR